MRITLEDKGLDNLLRQVQAAASTTKIKQADTAIVERGAEQAQKIMQSHVPVSLDNSKSGRRGARPSGHAKPNVPRGKPKQGKGGMEAEVGWKLSDNSEYFYMKFVNWGTVKKPPQDFVEVTRSQVDPILQKVAEEEYQKLITETLGKVEG